MECSQVENFSVFVLRMDLGSRNLLHPIFSSAGFVGVLSWSAFDVLWLLRFLFFCFVI
jgi:hypothetical protein